MNETYLEFFKRAKCFTKKQLTAMIKAKIATFDELKARYKEIGISWALMRDLENIEYDFENKE